MVFRTTAKILKTDQKRPGMIHTETNCENFQNFIVFGKKKIDKNAFTIEFLY